MAFLHSEIGKRLKDVREQLGVSTASMAAACGVDEDTYVKLERGTLDPVPGDFILIAARLLKTDFRYFISDALDDIEKETRQVFRALADPTHSDLLAIRRFMLFCMAERELEELSDASSLPLPPQYPLPGSSERLHRDQGKRAAIAERQRLLLGDRPIDNIFAVLRSQGVRLCRHKLDDTNLSGVTIAHPRAGVCVLVNYDDDLYRQFFSAAHEYGHVLFDRQQINSKGCVVSYRFSKDQLIEIRANAFAAEFLLPAAALAKHPKPRDLASLQEFIGRVAREYYVNTATVAIRTREAGWISEKTLASFQKVKPVIIRREEKQDPDISKDLTPIQQARIESAIRRGINSRFLELLRRALTENVITFARAAEMMDMTTDEARDFVRATGTAL